MLPARLKTMISAMVTAHSAFGKSLGFFTSAIKLGIVICPMNVYEIFKKAPIPFINAFGWGLIAHTVHTGSPSVTGSYPFGWVWIVAKMMHSMTAIKVKMAEKVAMKERVSEVWGREAKKQMIVVTRAKTIVHSERPVMVFRYFAPTST